MAPPSSEGIEALVVDYGGVLTNSLADTMGNCEEAVRELDALLGLGLAA